MKDESNKPIVIQRSDLLNSTVQPQLIHSQNCIIKTEFLLNDNFKKNFNYMMRYQF